MEPNNSVLVGLKLEFDVADDPQGNCAYTDDARRSNKGPDHSCSNHAAVSEQPSGAGFRVFGLNVKSKTEPPDPDLTAAEDPFATLNLQVKKEPVSESADNTSDNCAGSRGPDHAAVSEQPSGTGFGMFGLKAELKTETPDPDMTEAEDPFTALNIQVKKEPVSSSGDETSDNVTEGCDVSDRDRPFTFSNSDLNFDNDDSNTNNRKENNKVLIENHVSKATNSSRETKSFNSDVSKQWKLLSIEKKYHSALAQLTGETLTGDRSLATKPSVGEVTDETQTPFASSFGEKRQQNFDEEDTSKEFSNHQEIFNKNLKCYLCGKVFSRSNNLKAHQLIHTGDKTYKCTDCGKAFLRSVELKTHQRFHRGDKPYQCADCDKAFSQTQDLKRHQRIHTGDKPYQCTDCGKAFNQVQYLKTHQRIHKGDKPYQCTGCSKAFSDSCNLKRHQRIHTGDKPYQCTKCDKAFCDSSSLRNHQRIHTGDKPYQCMDCGKAFGHSQTLKTHQRIHMTN